MADLLSSAVAVLRRNNLDDLVAHVDAVDPIGSACIVAKAATFERRTWAWIALHELDALANGAKREGA